MLKTSDSDLAAALFGHDDDRGPGGIAGSKSGQRVAGSSKVEALSNAVKSFVPSGTGVLHGETQILAAVMKAGATEFAADRAAEEKCVMFAQLSVGFENMKTSGFAGLAAAGNPDGLTATGDDPLTCWHIVVSPRKWHKNANVDGILSAVLRKDCDNEAER